jgi:hypothetical protein
MKQIPERGGERMKTRGWMWMSVAMCLGACSDIPTVICEDDQGGAISCELLDMSPDMPADITPDLPIDLGVPDLAPDMVRDLGVEDAAPDLEVDMCMPAEMLQVCNGVCGMQSDGCEGEVDCGEPLTQADVCVDACGEQSDGCGGTVACEPCACVGGVAAQPTCGACNLGVSSCDGDIFSCDLYDIPGLDAQTDCDSALLYVNGAFDGMMSDGSRGNPFKTIAEANAVAKDRGAIAILVGGNENVIYQEVLEVQNGVSVVGGWSSEWTVDIMRKPTVTPSLPVTGDVFGARAMNVADNETLLANLRIVTPDFGKALAGQSGRHNHGLYAFNAGKLVMRDMLIQAGKGEDGADGADGMPGADGPDGQAGGEGCAMTALVCVGLGFQHVIQVSHPMLQNELCDISRGNTSNGRNGLGGTPLKQSEGLNDDATVGEDAPSGAEGGTRGRATQNSAIPRNGGDGETAMDSLFMSSQGVGGNCQPTMFDGNTWVVSAGCNGSEGGIGINGGGGGGGGGASHSLTRLMPNILVGDPSDFYVFGPDGGSGGAGGCAGEGGQGGVVGGNSVGLLLDASQGFVISMSVVRSTMGGSGGAGGKGGAGGSGGQGGDGGSQICTEYADSIVVPASCEGAEFSGGDGGDGAAGVSGGAGGGGGGGSTFGMYCHDMTFTSDPSNNVQAGSPGMGGESEGNDGVSGLSSDLQGCE